MYCKKCGKQIPGDSKWCPFCGQKNCSVNWDKIITCISCFFCLLSSAFFIVAGWCSINYIRNASFSIRNEPLDFLVATVTWIAFGLGASCLVVFGLLLDNYRKHH
jgi:hypothetical protein